MVDALGLNGEEGRTSLRKATGSRQGAAIRGWPNGETQWTGMFIIFWWIHSQSKQYLVKWNISVARGKENKAIP